MNARMFTNFIDRYFDLILIITGIIVGYVLFSYKESIWLIGFLMIGIGSYNLISCSHCRDKLLHYKITEVSRE